MANCDDCNLIGCDLDPDYNEDDMVTCHSIQMSIERGRSNV